VLYDHSELEARRSSGCSIYMEYSLHLYLYKPWAYLRLTQISPRTLSS